MVENGNRSVLLFADGLLMIEIPDLLVARHGKLVKFQWAITNSIVLSFVVDHVLDAYILCRSLGKTLGILAKGVQPVVHHKTCLTIRVNIVNI